MYALGTDTERHPPAFHVGTGNVQFYHIDFSVKTGADLFVVFDGLTRHVGDDYRVFTLQEIQIFGKKRIKPRILQADRI